MKERLQRYEVSKRIKFSAHDYHGPTRPMHPIIPPELDKGGFPTGEYG